MSLFERRSLTPSPWCSCVGHHAINCGTIRHETLEALNAADAGDECRVVEVDGEPVRVQAFGDWDEKDHAAFASIVRAAKAKFAADNVGTQADEPRDLPNG